MKALFYWTHDNLLISLRVYPYNGAATLLIAYSSVAGIR